MADRRELFWATLSSWGHSSVQPSLLIRRIGLYADSLRAAACEKLAGLKQASIEVTSAVLLPAGPVSAGTGNPPIDTPARYTVTVIARPVADSEIKMEVWLPAAN
jgi:hypothetical protein